MNKLRDDFIRVKAQATAARYLADKEEQWRTKADKIALTIIAYIFGAFSFSILYLIMEI